MTKQYRKKSNVKKKCPFTILHNVTNFSSKQSLFQCSLFTKNHTCTQIRFENGHGFDNITALNRDSEATLLIPRKDFLSRWFEAGLWSRRPSKFGWLGQKLLGGGAGAGNLGSGPDRCSLWGKPMDQIDLEPEPKISDDWSRSLKFEYRLRSPGFKAIRATT